MQYYTLSGFTAGMPTPESYFGNVMDKIPNMLDTITYRIQQPVVYTFLGIAVIAGFIFSLDN